MKKKPKKKAKMTMMFEQPSGSQKILKWDIEIHTNIATLCGGP